MASKKSAGKAFVEIYADDSKLVRALKIAANKVKGFLDSVRKMGTRVGVLFGVAAAGLTYFGAKAAEADSIMRKFVSNFGEGTKEAQKFATSLKAKVGGSLLEIMEAMSNFRGQALFQGMEGEDANNWAKEMTTRMYDLAAAQRLTAEEARAMMEDLGAGAGAEKFAKMGINISQGAIAAKKFELGIAGINNQMLDQRANIIAATALYDEWAKASGTLGAAGRETDSPLVQFRKLKGVLADLQYELGIKLLPIINKVLASIINWLEPLLEADDIVGAIGTRLGAALKGLGSILWGALKGLASAFADMIKVAIIDGVKEAFMVGPPAPKPTASTTNPFGGLLDAGGALISGILNSNTEAVKDNTETQVDTAKTQEDAVNNLKEQAKLIMSGFGDNVLGGFFAGNELVFGAVNLNSELQRQTGILRSIDNKIGQGLAFE